MTTYVLVHGGFQGGWSYKRVARLLRDAGHDVYTPTLTGLGERSHLAHYQINLDTHIMDVVNVLLWEDLAEIVLLGHSYGGMVITGVADRLPDRVAALVYLDAIVPKDGDSLFSLRHEYLEQFMSRAAASNGVSVTPSPASEFDISSREEWNWMDGKTTAHPIACFAQAIQLEGRIAVNTRKIYVYAENGICDGMYDVYRGQPGAEVIALPRKAHSIMLEQPERLAQLLQAIR
jgi:pimeloyl-ACP methyl ester carboxylesterase